MRNEYKFSGLDYKDVYIVPQYSEIDSRSKVDLSVELTDKCTLQVPVISANMDTVTGWRMAVAMYKAGAIGALHRFMTIEDNILQYSMVRAQNTDCFVSIGVNRDSQERAIKLYEMGARLFIIDIAHGHSKLMKDMLGWLRATLPSVFIVAGNVATYRGTMDLAIWGADAIKVGIGPGAVCLTKNVTGVTVPQFGAIEETADAAEDYTSLYRQPIHVIADGGIREYGDVAKAIGAGASMVMAGGLFSGTDEAPGDLIDGKKVYRGMASRGAMNIIRSEEDMPTPEGTSILVSSKGPVGSIVSDIRGGLKSAFSYSNALNMASFHSRVRFGIRK